MGIPPVARFSVLTGILTTGRKASNLAEQVQEKYGLLPPGGRAKPGPARRGSR
jgi:hypothetical protein